jgi:hypothetical protein
MAQGYAVMDEYELAMDWLENAVARGYIGYPHFAQHGVIWRRLDGNPRFRTLLEEVRREWERFEP